MREGEAIEACAGAKLILLDDANHCRVPNHQKVERLIHKELQQYRRKFSCNCKSKRGENHGDTGKLMEHSEWFEIDRDTARNTINRWRTWMRGNPYENRRLNAKENFRINYYWDHPDHMDKLLKQIDGKNAPGSWDWDEFMEHPAWQLHWMQFHKFVLGRKI